MTDNEFWMAVRAAALSLVDAIEAHKLKDRIKIRTAEMRNLVKAYPFNYPFPPVAAEEVRERIAELIAKKAAEKAEALTTGAECGKL